MKIEEHRFLKVRRTLIDVSSAELKREGILLYRPGWWWLRWIPVVMSWFAWLPWPGKRLECLNVRMFECSNVGGHSGKTLAEVWEKIEETIGVCKFVTIYLGNGSEKSKLTIKARLESGRERRELTDCRIDGLLDCRGGGLTDCRIDRLTDCEGGGCVIVKLGNTEAASAAIRNEVRVLKLLHEKSIGQSVNSPISQSVNLTLQIPRVIGEVGSFGPWTWSVQTVLPRGKSPNRLQKEHFEFLEKLKEVGISHGDFAPWNCAIVSRSSLRSSSCCANQSVNQSIRQSDNVLVVWDWEDAGPWVEGVDEAWFRKQVKELLGEG